MFYGNVNRDGLPYLKIALASSPSKRQYVLSYAEALLMAGQAIEALAVIKVATRRGVNSQKVRSLRKRIETALREIQASEGSERADRKESAAAHRQISQGEHADLITLFNAGRHEELERLARLLAEQYPDSGLCVDDAGRIAKESLNNSV